MSSEERLLEFAIASNFEYVAKIHIPEVSRGCLGYATGALNRNERLRQEYLATGNKTDGQIMESIYSALQKCPSLASRKFKNFAGQDMFPLWYFVLSGGRRDQVEEVYSMHPAALAEPLKQEVTERGQEIFTLLHAACLRSSAIDEGIVYLAHLSPNALSTRFHYEPTPFAARIIDGPRHEGQSLASLETFKALVPPGVWNLECLNDIISLGYNGDVLHYSIDMILSGDNDQRNAGHLDLSGSFQSSKCLLDRATASEIERLLGSKGTVKIVHFHCTPQQWTREGMAAVLHCLQRSETVQTLTLQLHSGMFASEDQPNESDMELLQDVFATNGNLQNLTLKADKDYFDAIVKGIVQGWSGLRRKLELTTEVNERQTGSSDMTGPILQLIGAGALGKLYIKRNSAQLRIDLCSIWSALRQDTALRSLEMTMAMPPPGNSDIDPLHELLILLKTNVTLESVVLYSRMNGLDYTGFTKCPKEIKPVHRFHLPNVYNLSLGQKIMHYLRLNRCSRKRIRMDKTSKEDLVALLAAAKERLKGVEDEHLKHFNVAFGLLVECPSLWSPTSE